MQKDVFFITGNKGGCGKTMISSYLIDYLLRSGIDNDKIFIVDGEASGKQATLTRIMKTSFPENIVNGIELSHEQGYEKIMNMMIDGNYRYCVSDSGGGLQEELEKNLEFINSFSDYEIIPHIVSVVGSSPESSSAARSFLTANKDINIDLNFVLLAAPVNDIRPLTIEGFDFSQSEDIIKITSKRNIKILFIPTIRQDFFNITHDKGYLPIIVLNQTNIFNTATRMRFKQFFTNTIDSVMNKIVGNSNE